MGFHLDLEWIIFTRLGTTIINGTPILMWEFVWPIRSVCLFDSTILWHIMRILCVVSAWGSDYDISHQIGYKVLSNIYIFGLLLTYEGSFGLKADNIYTIESWLLQMVLESIFNFNVRVYLFDLTTSVYLFNLTILWDTIRTLYLHESNYDISYQIGEKILNVIYVRASFNLVDMFWSCDISFKRRVDNIYTVGKDLNLVDMFWSCNISFKLRADNIYTVGNGWLQVIYVCLGIMYLRFISWPIVGKGIYLSSLYEQKMLL